MLNSRSFAASIAVSVILCVSSDLALADTVPLTLDPSLPGVLQPRVTDALANVFNFDNSIAGSAPVAVTSQTVTTPSSQVVKTETTFTYSREFPKAQTPSDLLAFVTKQNVNQLANMQTGSVTGIPTRSTTNGAGTTGQVISLTNLGASAQSFSETVYFHAQQYQTKLVGGAPGAGGTGVVLTTLTNGVPGTASEQLTTAGQPATSTAFGAFSTPSLVVTTASPNGLGAKKYVYTWTRTVTTTVTTPYLETDVTKSTIQNILATTTAFSNLNFSLVSAPGVWSSASPINNAQGSFAASDFTNTVFSTNNVMAQPGATTVQYLMLPNNGTPELPTLYPIHHADEYAFLISGTLAPYSTGSLQLSVSAVPEPSTWALMLLGFGAFGLASYRSSRKSSTAAA